MKKFKFKLHGLLRLREFKEHQEKLALAQINQEIAKVKDRIKVANEEITVAYESANKLTEQGISGDMIRFYPMFINSKREFIKQQEYLIVNLQRQHEEQRQKLVKVQGDLKVIENMKEKQFDKFKKKQQKDIQEKIEDILMARQAIKMGRDNGSY